MPRRKKAESGPTTLIESPVGNDYMKRRTMPSTLGDWMFSSYTMQEPHCNEPEVSQHSVLSIAPFFRAVSILCSLPARIPVILKRRVANNKSELANNDERYFMAKKKPNGLLRARTWKKTMMLHVQIAPGGGFSEIIRDPDTGFPLAIVPLDPNRMAWGILEENRLSKMVYLYSERVGVPARHILPNDILHFKGLSYDTIMGMDTVELHKEEFSLTLARRQYAGKYFIDNCHLRGFLMIPSGIDLNLFANMMTTIGAHMREQAKNPLKAVPLFDGVQWQPTQDNPQSSQLQESMKMTPAQASQLTGVPEFFLGGEHKGSYNALENILQGFFITTVDDHFDELESEMDDKLLTEDELRKEELFFQ